jgi:4a-hydroxytetrahydrobiopterin dehydratase
MRLEQTDRERFVADHPEWTLTGEQISRTFEFEGFPQSVAFVVQVGFAAEAADHHPDIDIRWNKVTLELSTHSEGALTAKDTNLAATIDELTTA